MATPLSAFTGDTIYIDTMMPYMLLRGIAEAQPLHYAAMQRVGCVTLASNDPDFDRIPAIERYTI